MTAGDDGVPLRQALAHERAYHQLLVRRCKRAALLTPRCEAQLCRRVNRLSDTRARLRAVSVVVMMAPAARGIAAYPAEKKLTTA